MPTEVLGDRSGETGSYPDRLLHESGFGGGDMLCDLIEEHGPGVDHRDLPIAVMEWSID